MEFLLGGYVYPDDVSGPGLDQSIRRSKCGPWVVEAPRLIGVAEPPDTYQVVIASDDNLVRVWRFSNADQSWSFYDPRPAFASANTLVKTGAGDIVWVNVTAEQEFQGATLFPGWNLISLN